MNKIRYCLQVCKTFRWDLWSPFTATKSDFTRCSAYRKVLYPLYPLPPQSLTCGAFSVSCRHTMDSDSGFENTRIFIFLQNSIIGAVVLLLGGFFPPPPPQAWLSIHLEARYIDPLIMEDLIGGISIVGEWQVDDTARRRCILSSDLWIVSVFSEHSASSFKGVGWGGFMFWVPHFVGYWAYELGKWPHQSDNWHS